MPDTKEQPPRYRFHDRTPNSMAWKLWLHTLGESDTSLLAKGQKEFSEILQNIRKSVLSGIPRPGTLPLSTDVIGGVLTDTQQKFTGNYELQNGHDGFFSAIGMKLTRERISRWDFSYDLQNSSLPVRFFTMNMHARNEPYRKLVLGHISKLDENPLEAADRIAGTLAGNFLFTPTVVHPEPLSIRVEAPWDTYTFYAFNFEHHTGMCQAWLACDRKPMADTPLPPRWGNPA